MAMAAVRRDRGHLRRWPLRARDGATAGADCVAAMRFPILEARERSSSGTMCMGAVLLFMGSCGWSRRRPPHWPFEFGAYRWFDWVFAGAGLLVFAFGLKIGRASCRESV